MDNSAKPNNRKKQQTLAMALIGGGLVILGGLALVFLLKPGNGAFGAGEAYPSAVPVQVDFPAPELNLTDLQGNPVSLSDYRGKWVLLNHWAFWCPPCKDELPTLKKYYETHKDQKFTIIGIEDGGEKRDVEHFANEYHLTYPVWLDPRQQATIAFRVYSLPSSFMINPDGQVVLAWAGPINRAMLEKHITPLLEN